MSPAPASSQWMLVGRIVGVFGVRGEVKVELHTDYPDRFKSLRSVYLGAGHSERRVVGSRLHKGQALLRLEGLETPEEGAKLRGEDIWVPRSDAVDLPEGHYFLDDLVGISVRTESGAELGEVADVLRTGSNDVYVVRHGSSETLVPGIRDAVVDLDLAAKSMLVADWVLREQ